jgi:hypothetical protein
MWGFVFFLFFSYLRASAMQLGKAHCKPRPILLKIAQNLEGVHQILLKNGKILPHPPTQNFENVVFSMRDFTYVKFLQFFFLEKYLTFI